MTTAVARRIMQPRTFEIAAIAIAAAVAVMVFRASPVLYVAVAVAAAWLAWAWPLAGWALPLVWLAVVGTELTPQMIGVAGPQMRIFDVLALGAIAGRLVRSPVRVAWKPFGGSLLLLAAIAVAALAFPGGSAEEASEVLHQVALVGVATLLAGEALRTAGRERLLLVLLLAGGAAAVKTVVIWAIGVDVLNGPESVLQVRSQVLPDLLVRRTILIGGSAVVAVATAVGLVVSLLRGPLRVWGGVVFLAGSTALVMGQTRAYVGGVVVAAIAGVAFVVVRHRDRLLWPRASTAAMLVAGFWIAGLAVSWDAERDPLTGMVERVVSPSAESTSLSFRGDESSAILDAVGGVRLITGAGLGGQFELRAAGLDPTGDNGYAHSWVFWVLLKGGIVALALTLGGVALALGRLLPWRARGRDPALTLFGVALIVLLVASLGANILPLAEGAWLLGTILAVSAGAGRATASG
jgi:hypothetical protein